MGVLPEIEYGAPVQTSSDDIARIGQAARRTFGVLEQGFTKYGQAMVKNEVEGATLALRTGLADLEPKSVLKKMKQKEFAAAVSRDDIRKGAEVLGLPLEEHIARTIEALRKAAPALGLKA